MRVTDTSFEDGKVQFSLPSWNIKSNIQFPSEIIKGKRKHHISLLEEIIIIYTKW